MIVEIDNRTALTKAFVSPSPGSRHEDKSEAAKEKMSAVVTDIEPYASWDLKLPLATNCLRHRLSIFS